MAKNITLEDLAAMVQRGFSQQAEQLEQFQQANAQQHAQMNRNITHLTFKSSEYVHRTEFLRLQAEVTQLKERRSK